MFELHGGPGEDTDLKAVKVPEKYGTIPAEVQGVAVDVGEAYARLLRTSKLATSLHTRAFGLSRWRGRRFAC